MNCSWCKETSSDVLEMLPWTDFFSKFPVRRLHAFQFYDTEKRT